jgi:hypothetical protein
MSASDRFIRAKGKAKGRSIRIDTAATDPALVLTTVATGGTVTSSTFSNTIKITLNGTALRIPVLV